MLCASACPLEAPRTRSEPFEAVMDRLARFERPLLGCLNGGAAGHDRVVCFGELTEEHLLALAFRTRDTIRFNATCCDECPNRAALEKLHDRVERVEALDLWPGTRLRIETRAIGPELDELPTERRFVFQRLLRVLPGSPSPTAGSSERRRLIASVTQRLTEDARAQVTDRYRYHVDLAPRCNSCRRCASICPTGAISRHSGGGRRQLAFESARCTGCGLCEEFCPDNVVRVIRGSPATAPDAQPFGAFPVASTLR